MSFCWHKWSAWKETKRGEVYWHSFANTQGLPSNTHPATRTEITQERQCQKCLLKDILVIKA